MQFGKLTLTTVLSQQKGQSSVIQAKGGAQLTDYEIYADDYEANRHFFLSQYFRDIYDHVIRINEMVDNTRELLNTALEANFSLMLALYVIITSNLGESMNPQDPTNPPQPPQQPYAPPQPAPPQQMPMQPAYSQPPLPNYMAQPMAGNGSSKKMIIIIAAVVVGAGLLIGGGLVIKGMLSGVTKVDLQKGDSTVSTVFDKYNTFNSALSKLSYADTYTTKTELTNDLEAATTSLTAYQC